VERVYQDLLGRAVDAAGRTTWSAAVRAGAPRVGVANGVTGSDEFRTGLIHEAYRHYLGRDADPVGLASWLAAMRRGATVQQLEAGFLASPEYVAAAGPGWVQAMYVDVLDRDAQSREVELWEDVLRRGAASRQGIALGILLSDEHLGAVVDADYGALLGRGIDPTGRRGWISAIQAGTRYEQVLGGILASNEYWVLGIPGGGFALRGDGRIADFPVDAPEAQVVNFLTAQYGAEPEAADLQDLCPPGRQWQWDELLVVVRTTDDAGQTVEPYAAGWLLFGPPSAATARLSTPEGLRIGDPENRIPEVYPGAVAEVDATDPASTSWVTDATEPAFAIGAFDEGDGSVVDVIASGEACGE
jgi:hypothetical protein